MKKTLICLTLALLTGCSSDPKPNRIVEAAKIASGRLAAPSQSLSTFSNFELKSMELSPLVSGRKEKVEVAKQLEDKLRARLLPLIEEWKADVNSPRTAKTLVITPKLQDLHVVSGGARFWVGGMAGDSNIDMDLTLTDGETGAVIANPTIARTANGMAGGWSVGATDKNLLNYIVEISYQYLIDNYKK